MIQQPVIICHRDPDSSNEFRVFDQQGVKPIVIDVDYGRANLKDEGEFREWAKSQLAEAKWLLEKDTANTIAAAMHLIGAVSDAAANHEHSWPACRTEPIFPAG